MTLSKRKICFTANYVHPEFLERAALESSGQKSTLFEDQHMGQLTGVMSQIGHLAAYSMELLDGLFRISTETAARIESVSERTAKLAQAVENLEKEPQVEKLVDITAVSVVHKKQEIKVPHIFTRITNADEIVAQYNQCAPPPLLTKIDHILGGEQCQSNYSFPRFFFDEWYKSELNRQEKKKEEKKKKKLERKQRREERRKNDSSRKDKIKKAKSMKKMQSFTSTYKNEVPNGVGMAAPAPPPKPKGAIAAPKPPPPPPQAFRRSRNKGEQGNRSSQNPLASGLSGIKEDGYEKMEVEDKSKPPRKPPPRTPPPGGGTAPPPRAPPPGPPADSPRAPPPPGPPPGSPSAPPPGAPPPAPPTSSDAPPPTPPPAKPVVDTQTIMNQPQYAKYKTMLKVNLPEGAIRNKMEVDKIPEDIIDMFCPNTVFVKPAAKVTSSEDEGQTTGEEAEDLEPPVEEEAPPGPPEDWEETDDGQGGIYFINKGTWESSWVAPMGWKAYKLKKEEESKKARGGLMDALKGGKKLRRISITPGSHVVADPRTNVMAGIKGGAIKLKKAAPLPPKPVDARDQLMATLKKGKEGLKTGLQHVEVKTFNPEREMDDAVAKLLANRAAIAGESDSDSDSDSDYDFDSDDDYP
ncbi:hypothetical protein TrLO_g7936 [Triparma laevis f. longispina]|uniref:Wiskott-Aldrich syndrome protein family member n=1 Tax=Triparma laevis f. longispina TaxID=1714387 RepID=A0A9W7FJR0_9STRA|nr:hypothetical protein TrLO_g7936 [Triparma laevis f. longispina]